MPGRQVVVTFLGESAPLKRTLGEVEGAATRTGTSFGSTFAGMGKAAALVAGPLAALGLIHTETEFADAAHAAEEFSKKTGMSAEQASLWIQSAKIMGIEAGSMTMAVKKSATASEAQAKELANGKSMFDINKASLEKYGMTLLDNWGHQKTFNQVLRETADRFARMPDGPEKSAQAVALFGRSGMDLIPVLDGGSAALDTLNQQAKDTGSVLTDSAVASGEDAHKTFKKLGEMIQSVTQGIAQFLLPVIKFLSEHLNIVIPILGALTGAFLIHRGIIMATAIAHGIHNAILGVKTAITVIATGAQIAFNVAMLIGLGPILLIVAAVALLVAGFILIVTHISPIIGAFKTTFGWVKEHIIDPLAAAIGGLVGIIIGIVGVIAGPLGGVLDVFKNTIGWVWDHILKPVIDGIRWLIDNVSKVAGFLSGGNQNIANAYHNASPEEQARFRKAHPELGPQLGYAEGGDFIVSRTSGGVPITVGEGLTPERVTITPLDGRRGQSGNTYNTTVNVASNADARAIAREVVFGLKTRAVAL